MCNTSVAVMVFSALIVYCFSCRYLVELGLRQLGLPVSNCRANKVLSINCRLVTAPGLVCAVNPSNLSSSHWHSMHAVGRHAARQVALHSCFAILLCHAVGIIDTRAYMHLLLLQHTLLARERGNVVGGQTFNGRKIHPPPKKKKSTQNKKFIWTSFSEQFRWVPDSCHREEGKSSRELFETFM